MGSQPGGSGALGSCSGRGSTSSIPGVAAATGCLRENNGEVLTYASGTSQDPVSRAGDLFFAILVEDTLYLKVGDGNRATYQDRGIQPFSYEGKDGRRATMSYYPVPAELLDDPDALAPWARQAIGAARRAAAKPARSGCKAPGPGEAVRTTVTTHPPTGRPSEVVKNSIPLPPP